MRIIIDSLLSIVNEQRSWYSSGSLFTEGKQEVGRLLHGTARIKWSTRTSVRASLKYNIARLGGLHHSPPSLLALSLLVLARAALPSSRVPVIRAVFMVMHFAAEEKEGPSPSLRS